MMKGTSRNSMDTDLTLDVHQSVYRERLLEHLLIGDLLKYSWLHAGGDAGGIAAFDRPLRP
jgi:hypothetical protein